MMKKVFIFCLLAVISVQAMPNLDDEAEDSSSSVGREKREAQLMAEEDKIDAESADEEVAKTRNKRYADNDLTTNKGLNVDVDVDVAAPPDVLNNANIDVDVGVRAKNKRSSKNGLSEDCDCVVSLREEMKSFAEMVDDLLAKLTQLRDDALASNDTEGAALPRSSGGLQVIDVVGKEINDTMEDFNKYLKYYCRWIYFWGRWYYYCRYYYSYGRKRRDIAEPVTTDISIDEDHPDCTAYKLATILKDIASYANLLQIAEEELHENSGSSEHVLEVVNPAIDLINSNRQVIEDVINDLENLPC